MIKDKKNNDKSQRSKNMEEFVTKIKDSMDEEVIRQHDQINENSKFRELFCHVLNNSAIERNVEIINVSKEGDIEFGIPMKQMGINFDIYSKYKEEIMSEYTASFLGELLVRENMEKFIKILVDLKDDYIRAVNRFEHNRFGIRMFKDKVIFVFNLRHIQSILVENFKRKMW